MEHSKTVMARDYYFAPATVRILWHLIVGAVRGQLKLETTISTEGRVRSNFVRRAPGIVYPLFHEDRSHTVPVLRAV